MANFLPGNGLNTQREERASVNTRGLQLYNINGFIPSTMAMNFWNDSMFQVRIHPAKPKEQQTDREKYDYQAGASTALTVIKACELIAYVPEIKEAYKNGIETSRYVNIASVNLFGIGTKKVGDEMVYYVGIFKGLNENRIPSQVMYYEFSRSNIIADYNPETGDWKSAECHDSGEFDVFVAYLEAGIHALTNATAHSIRTVNRFSTERLDGRILSILAATGGTDPFPSRSGNGGGYGNRNPFKVPARSNNDASAVAPTAPAASSKTAAGTDLDEEIPF